MQKSILVTGSTGFVGRALVQALRRANVPVVAGMRSVSDMDNDGITRRAYGDLSPSIDWRACLEGVDIVVHLAARAHVLKEDCADPLNAFRQINVLATINLARQAADAGVRRFIFVSSIGVNGNATKGRAFTEADAPAPIEPYAFSKAEAEVALRELGRETGMEITILRPALVYGADAPGNFGRLLKLAASRPFLPIASVNNMRSFVSVDNLVDLIITCTIHRAAANETFLVADGEDVSTPDLLRKLGNAMKRPARLLPVPVPLLKLGARCLGKAEMFEKLCGSLQVDIGKARRILQWKPVQSLDQGLERAAIGYLQKHGAR